MSEINNAFISESVKCLRETFLPKIERSLERLTAEDVWWRANENCNSIGNLLLHLAGNVRQWIISGVGGAPDSRVRQQEFDERNPIPIEELIGKLRATVEEACQVLSTLDSATLLEQRLIQKKEVTILYAIYHVVEHFSMHTGQILLITKMRTGADLKFYDMSQGKPVETWHKK